MQPDQSIVCSWSGFSDTESPITEFHIAMGSAQGDNSLLSGVTVSGETSKYTISGQYKFHFVYESFLKRFKRLAIEMNYGMKIMMGNVPFTGVTSQLSHGSIYYVTVTAVNTVGLEISAFSLPITLDTTPPVTGKVVDLHSVYRLDFSDNAATVTQNSVHCSTKEGLWKTAGIVGGFVTSPYCFNFMK